ncbi:MFS transporter [Roseomonas frigidaquae]|uniref:MFS transporter n=1 Tax=Falsiroseomonas frigidaquae TaxID=487318 RepID=A0ABX1EUF0_9PROT|nr:MFS transporter [Falsiroseomonas frigidaquae]
MSEPSPPGARRVVLALGTAQTLAWASSYYLPAILAAPMAREFGISTAWVFGAFSAALIVSALAGPAVGRVIDAKGGRGVLTVSNLVLAAGLVGLGLAQDAWSMAAAWLVLGFGMAMGLYDAAFATLAGLYGRAARGPITGITLLAGFASTVGWPLSALLEESFGWRGACLAWAGLHLLVALPLNRLLVPKAPPPEQRSAAPEAEAPAPSRLTMPLLAYVFAGSWFIAGAMAAHLPALLQAAGATAAAAVAAGALIGPAQVAARVAEFGLLRRFHPLVSARLAMLGHPLGALALVLVGGPAAAAFAVLHGMGNGVMTIAKGTLPLAVFGPGGYGARQGLLGAPARLLQAASPFLFGLMLERGGVQLALGVTSALALTGCLALLLLRAAPAGVVQAGK